MNTAVKLALEPPPPERGKIDPRLNGRRFGKSLMVSVFVHIAFLAVGIGVVLRTETFRPKNLLQVLAHPQAILHIELSQPVKSTAVHKQVAQTSRKLPKPSLVATKQSIASFAPHDRSKCATQNFQRDLKDPQQLPLVLERFGGFIAFGSPKHGGYANKMFHPGDWSPYKVDEPLVSLNYYYYHDLIEANRWEFIRRLRSDVPPELTRVYAVFPPDYGVTIDQAINRELARTNLNCPVEVDLAWDSSSPEGFELLAIKPLRPKEQK